MGWGATPGALTGRFVVSSPLIPGDSNRALPAPVRALDFEQHHKPHPRRLRQVVTGATCVFLFCLSTLSADTLYKKNGTVLRDVTIVGQTRMQVRYRKEGEDKIRYVAKSQLRRITYEKKTEEEKEAEAKKRAAERERKRKLEEARRRKAEALRKKRAAEARAARQRDSLQGAIRRNIVLPGWGQWHIGQETKGAVFMGAFAGSLFYAYLFSAELQTATAAYLDPTPFALAQSLDNGLIIGNLMYSQRGAAVEAAGAKVNQAVLLMTLIWAGAFLDLSYTDFGTGAPTRTRTRSTPKSKPPTESKGGRGPGVSFFLLPPIGPEDKHGAMGVAVHMRF